MNDNYIENLKKLKKVADRILFVKDFNNTKTIDVDMRVLEYLKNSEVIAATGSNVIDEVANKETNVELLAYSDGKYIWDSRDIYYYETYGMPLKADFIKRCLQ